MKTSTRVRRRSFSFTVGAAIIAFFVPQSNYFSRSHRVVAVDLRGHSKSDAPRQDYTMAGYAGDLVWLCANAR